MACRRSSVFFHECLNFPQNRRALPARFKMVLAFVAKTALQPLHCSRTVGLGADRASGLCFKPNIHRRRKLDEVYEIAAVD
jgi:hypothetical protein